jgi:hypothetical protein
MLPCQHLNARLIQEAGQLLQNEDAVTLEQVHWNGGGDCREDTKLCCVGDSLIESLLFLFDPPLAGCAIT